MKTKILYILVSKESDYYLEQFFISSCSLKYYNKDAHVVLLTDDKTNIYIENKCKAVLAYVSEVVKITFPEEFDNKKRSHYLKTNARNYFDGDYLFVDTDTIITSSLSAIDEFDMLMGAVLDLHCLLIQHLSLEEIKYKVAKLGYDVKDTDSYYNSGVMYVKDLPETRAFYRKWHNNYIEGNKHRVFTDQQSLLKTNVEMNIISTLDGIWNCQIINNISNLSNAKIIHYFCTGVHKENSTPPYKLMSRDTCEDIRKSEYQISAELIRIIENPKYLYNSPLKIFSGEDLKIVYSLQFHLLTQFYYRYYSVFKFVEKIIAFFRKTFC